MNDVFGFLKTFIWLIILVFLGWMYMTTCNVERQSAQNCENANQRLIDENMEITGELLRCWDALDSK